MGTRLELKNGGIYERTDDDSFYGVMTYINGQEVSGEVFKIAADNWDKFVEAPGGETE